MEDQSLQQVLQKYVENKATPGEIRWLLAHFHTESEDELMKLVMKGFDLGQHGETQNNPDQAILNRVYGKLQQDLGLSGESASMKRMRKIRNFAAVAAVLAGLSIGGYFLIHKQPSTRQTAQNQRADIAPGRNKPILTLAGGKQIILTGKNRQLAIQGNTRITKTADGQLVYQAGSSAANVPAPYNTVTNPRGSEAIHITLSDGTDAWLNAASSITYQTAFNGKGRNISITGEAAFRVKYNKDQPFTVTVNGQTTTDLGTTFDIKAYADEPAIKTTLLEGSISVAKNGQTKILKPGQQALTGNTITVTSGDMPEAFAWKNGYFIFNDENIQDIMRDISRWYGVDVSYQGDMSGKEFVGSVSRFKNVSEVLRKLEETGTIHFKTEGRRITVMP